MKQTDKHTTDRRCSSLDEAVFSVSLNGRGSNIRWANVKPNEEIVRPPTSGLAGETGVLPLERASGCKDKILKGQLKHCLQCLESLKF